MSAHNLEKQRTGNKVFSGTGEGANRTVLLAVEHF